MKKLLIFLFLTTLFSFPLLGTEKSRNKATALFNEEKTSFSGFGGATYSVGEINGEAINFIGARGGLIVNDMFVFGAAFSYLVYPTKQSDLNEGFYSGLYDSVAMGYGGALIGVHIMQKSMINFSFLTLLGSGNFVTYNSNHRRESDFEEKESAVDDYSLFFICEPTLMAHINLTSWMRLGVGASYRFINGINVEEYNDDDFSGFSFVISAEFGAF